MKNGTPSLLRYYLHCTVLYVLYCMHMYLYSQSFKRDFYNVDSYKTVNPLIIYTVYPRPICTVLYHNMYIPVLHSNTVGNY